MEVKVPKESLECDGILSPVRRNSVFEHFIKITFIYVYLSILFVIYGKIIRLVIYLIFCNISVLYISSVTF
jgi:hypothetical protein